MAVLVMKRINIYALKSNRKKILEALQLKGAVQLKSEQLDMKNFAKTDTSSAMATFEKNAQVNQSAVDELDKLVEPPKVFLSMFAGKEPVSAEGYNRVAEKAADVTQSAYKLTAAAKRITDNEADITRLETQIAALEPWAALDVPMRMLATKSTSIYIGSFPEELTESDTKQRLAEAFPEGDAIDVEVISAMKMQTNVFIVASAKYGPKLEAALRSLGFAYPPSPPKIPPKEQIKTLEGRIDELKAEIASSEKEIKSYSAMRADFLLTHDYFLTRAEKYNALGELWQSRHVFVISGYIPEIDSENVRKVLEAEFEAFVELEDVAENEDAPVKLKNGGFSAPVESVVEAYSLPGKGEIDPSKVMSIFYYVLFGIMLADAAYGLLMTVACAVLLKIFPHMSSNMRRAVRMFRNCGISTIFWGAMFGSYFGDAIPIVAETFFNTQLSIPPLWFNPLDRPMQLLVFSLLVGIIHIFTGLTMKLYTLVKQKQYKDILYDVIFWYMLVGGLIVAFISTSMFTSMTQITISLPPIVTTICLAAAGVGAVGIIATAGRESRNPGKRILKGLYGLYNLSGYLSDILSYSRLLALGLAASVISSVFNQMGAMFGGGVVGAIAFAIVFLIGHTLNIAINILGSYVHTNRLQFVEFFGKFYEGGGNKFEPFSEKTKYYNFTEEK